jgi:histidine phosphotransfer protein HptB
MMAYNPGALESSLAAAVGDQPMLIAELRGAFFASAKAHILSLSRAESVEDWRAAAQRLHSLAASFGAIRLMDVATQASRSVAIDHALLRKIERAIAALDL